MNKYKGILPKGYSIDGKYNIILFIKQGRNAETYRVKGNDGKIYFLKLFDYSKINRSSFDDANNLLEIEFLKKIKHENIVSYIDNGELIYENKKYCYLILFFIAGETLAERLSRESISTFYDIKQIISDVLKGLNYLHTLPESIIHNEITPQNIMLDLSRSIPKAVIIDFGYARSFHQSTKAYVKEGLNLNYIASECFNNLFSPQSDLFSIGAVMYHLLFGIPPWFKDVSKFQSEHTRSQEIVLKSRNMPLDIPKVSSEFVGYDVSVGLILKKSLCPNLDNRFQSAAEFLDVLNGEIEINDIDTVQKDKSDNILEHIIKREKIKGKGFDAIAGLESLKNEMRRSVISIIENPEKANKYGAKIPNGMLLYGPPGCGKTFFAKHFAEEVGYNFVLATPSTLKSRYVNATQENIAKMFEEAEKNAPTIIFIDEINELLPNRDSNAHEMSKSAVNEMLAQMDRTGEKGIFIIGACNYPDMIDPAMLRSGRLEKKFYLPPPDFALRRALFEMSLSQRKKVLDFGIDYDKLSELTSNYVSSDIEGIVNDATSLAMDSDKKISMNLLVDVIKYFTPFPIEELKKYEFIRDKMEGKVDGQKNKRSKIGFKP